MLCSNLYDDLKSNGPSTYMLVFGMVANVILLGKSEGRRRVAGYADGTRRL